jgi:3',5'-cyclic AMP phosphodiesterase CpdA
MTRITQISDTHLSRRKPHFVANWNALVGWIKEQRPSLIVHSGDVTVDGADDEDDLSYCAEILTGIDAPMLVVPGNHDVGEPKHPYQPVGGQRLERWRRHFGPDRWVHDLPNWRLIGFNSMILGSELADEEGQYRFVEESMATAGGRRVAWFCHQPLFINGFDDGDNGYWSAKPDPRSRYRALTQRFDVALVASGHIHRSRDMVVDGIQFVWCPSTAFVVGPDLQPPLPGEQTLGAVTYDFGSRDVQFQRLALPSLAHSWIDDVVDEVYPPR